MHTRGIHHSVVGLIAATSLLLVGCSSGDPEPSESLNPSPTVDPSAEPTDSPTTGVFDHRDSEMTDLDALARLVAPATGETWYDVPIEIATPSWAVGDIYLDQDFTAWYELGFRGSNTIVGFKSEAVEELFERAGDGTWEWIPFPSARAVITPIGNTFGFDEVPANTTIYYDSLTLPAAFTLPTGEQLLVPEYDRGTVDIPGRESLPLDDGDVVDQIGGYQVVRLGFPSRWIWSDAYTVTAPEDLSYEEFFYVLVTPYGMIIPLDYFPIGHLTDIAWSIDTSVSTDIGAYLVDLNDVGCGPRDSDHNTLVTGTVAADWVSAGTAADGTRVYVPTVTNPLTQPMYDVYVAVSEDFDRTPVSMAAFVNAPALVGLKVPGSSDWIVFLNSAYSGRMWC